jgi:glycosyltransferase involved in cell wall biosynthesis
MKIGLFHNLPPGGAKRAVYEEVKYLSNNNQLDLFCYSSTDDEFLSLNPFVDNIFRFEFDLNSLLSSYLKRIHLDIKNFIVLDKVSKNIAKSINEGNYDVCLVHPDMYTQAPFVLKHIDVPTLYFCEEYLRIVYEKQYEFETFGNKIKDYYEHLTRKVRKYIDKRNARSADLVVANSLFTKLNIENAYNIEAKYCHLGVDTNVFKPTKMSMNDRNKYILFVGDAQDKLGYKLANKILDILNKNENIELKCLGFSKGSKYINNDERMAEEYSNAVATICTHMNEPFGIPPLESMACETPVLAVNEGGYRETIINKKTGYLLKRDEKEFTNKIIYLLKHPKITINMGKNGREHVKKNFSWKKHSKKIEKCLLNLIE